jgi:hypothetical protein
MRAVWSVFQIVLLLQGKESFRHLKSKSPSQNLADVP